MQIGYLAKEKIEVKFKINLFTINKEMKFTHLHVHTHYSVLDGMSKIPDLVNKARKVGMNALAITDHGNMFGIKEFIDCVSKANKGVEPSEKFKPIVGVEAYCARRTLFDKDKDVKEINAETGREFIVDRSGWHLILLAKNKKGYQNLCKLVSQSWIDGFYDRPRIDKNILEKYHEGLIVCSACLGGEIPQKIMAKKIAEADEAIKWFKNLFGEDFYIEIQRHQTDKPASDTQVFERQQQIIPTLLSLAEKNNVKVIATNDVHFVEEEHAEAHDRLICLSTGRKLAEENRMHYTKQEWLKTPEEMFQIFKDIPQALENTQEIVDKVEFFSIDSDPLMPKFDIPSDFATEEEYRKKFSEQQLFDEFTQNEKGEVVLSAEEAERKIKKLGGYEKLYRIKLEADYLAKLAWEGAKIRYPNLTEDIKERIVFELHIMKTMGFPGYFLIVQDFIQAARDMGVSVGPGRGSAAGSVVAYCLKITDIDPLKYDLLFERFLNPDRISLPDIDIDFDDDGRGDVLRWVTEKYGKEKVAHIITYGTMATKSSIADVGRVQNVELKDVNKLKSLIPDKLDDYIDPDTGKPFNHKDATKKIPKVNINNCLKYVPEVLAETTVDNENYSSILKYAAMLEGTVRQTGVHACGVIIGADDLTNFVPLSTADDKDTKEKLIVTQYEGSVIENVGLIKMDFLGLKTLSIIKEALRNIKKTKGIELNIDKIPIDDKKTYELYSKGQTIGTFQFESPGMQKYLKELKPSVFEDLIAMNALYRPGPMDYIPQFIARKQGREPIKYDIPIMEKYLKDTYGITVYQEQVMLLSRLLADFTRGESDNLRKAMGKKLKDKLDQMKPDFIARGQKNGHNAEVLEKIWTDWEKFASYAFNKSHATCYSWVSYQTAYLKAHYPAEFMAANLTRNKDDITEVSKFMDECRAMGINVLEPDVNESDLNFTVNKNGDIRFGLGGVKGVGEGAVDAIITEREKNGRYKDIFDFVERINSTACNKKTIESLVYSGAFDSLKVDREVFFVVDEKTSRSFTDVLIMYGNRFKEDKNNNQVSLFGDIDDVGFDIKRPELPSFEKWSPLQRLNFEREMVGIYLSAHPLDRYQVALLYGCNTKMCEIKDIIARCENRTIIAGGILTSSVIRENDKGRYGFLTVEDYSGKHEFALFGKDFTKYVEYFNENNINSFILIKGNVQERRYADKDGNKRFEFRMSSIELLEDVYEEMIQSVTIALNLRDIDDLFHSELIPFFEKHKGETSLYLRILDSASDTNLCFLSRKIKVKVTKEFLEELSKMRILGFNVNSKNVEISSPDLDDDLISYDEEMDIL